jgi:hypothetical protein
VWENTNIPIYTHLKDSIFIVDVCRADGPRLLKFRDDDSYIQSVYPQPADNSIEIEYYIPASGRISFRLVNPYGVKSEAVDIPNQAKGFRKVNLSTDKYSPGVYFLLMERHGEISDIKKILIVK